MMLKALLHNLANKHWHCKNYHSSELELLAIVISVLSPSSHDGHDHVLYQLPTWNHTPQALINALLIGYSATCKYNAHVLSLGASEADWVPLRSAAFPIYDGFDGRITWALGDGHIINTV